MDGSGEDAHGGQARSAGSATPVRRADAAEVLDLATGFATVMALRCVVVVVARLLFVELPRPQVPVLVDAGSYAFPSRPARLRCA